VTVCLDEWNVRYDLPSHRRCNYTLAEGLYTACMLNSLLRVEGLFCANYAQLVNALGMIVTHERGAYLAPPGQVFRLYAQTLGEFVYEVEVESPSAYSEVGKVTFSLVDASATGNRTVRLHVVNRALEEAKVKLDTRAEELLTVTGPEPFALNTPEEPERVTISRRKVNGREVILPPHSTNTIVL
jgi:alpha-L-arabinofuranosidase